MEEPFWLIIRQKSKEGARSPLSPTRRRQDHADGKASALRRSHHPGRSGKRQKIRPATPFPTGWKLKNKEVSPLPLLSCSFNTEDIASTFSILPGIRISRKTRIGPLWPPIRPLMVIDAAKGVEPQTRKLFKVCTLRHIPIFTFINKMDREARDPYELLEEIEQELGIRTYPMNWPIGSGKEFQGVYDRDHQEIIVFKSVDNLANGQHEVPSIEADLNDPGAG